MTATAESACCIGTFRNILQTYENEHIGTFELQVQRHWQWIISCYDTGAILVVATAFGPLGRVGSASHSNVDPHVAMGADDECRLTSNVMVVDISEAKG